MKKIQYQQPELQLFEFDFHVELMQAASGTGSDMPVDSEIDPFGIMTDPSLFNLF